MATVKRAARKTAKELTKNIFQATVDILNAEGYEKVTFNNIAQKAGTGRPVLYRRWDSAFELLLEAEEYFDDDDLDSFAELDFTGHTLRENLITSLLHFEGSQPFLRAVMIELGRDNPTVHKYFDNLHKEQLYIMERMLSQAQLSDEIKHTVTDDVKLLPFNLLLYQAMIGQQAITTEFVTNLVDNIVLPAILAQQN